MYQLVYIFTAQIVEVSDTPLRRVIKDLGGWPVTDPTWDPDHAPQLELMMAVIKRNFTLGVLVEEWVGPDDRNSQKHIIQIGKLIPNRGVHYGADFDRGFSKA